MLMVPDVPEGAWWVGNTVIVTVATLPLASPMPSLASYWNVSVPEIGVGRIDEAAVALKASVFRIAVPRTRTAVEGRHPGPYRLQDTHHSRRRDLDWSRVWFSLIE